MSEKNMNTAMIKVAVCGAHMSGLPLNPQLMALGGEFVEKTRTSPYYKLFKLNGFTPERPGLLRVTEGGSAIALEVWQLPLTHYGAFVASVPAPLGFGTLVLEDGSQVQGFLCEAYATENAVDISVCGGWRAWLCKKETV
ncbi:allophanate hydrolase-related protein [Methylovorus mays]|uniref:allophanate hydrolase-related protein n=1 Tax=Methylovorus mays TaxID=184077 RepID=UPI001E50799C|nr:amidase [Methylovorus mays]MCB5207293.1 amidase [Methylovorus mays]